ncbi:MAG: spore coat protein U domain-containing protein [Nitrospirae bacterium]|nr:spore coat protein U domain-containing protein [Nitrospirota bacterium]
MKKLIVLVMALAVIMTAGSAMAGITEGTFQATANVAAACAFTQSPDIAFGTYDPTGGEVNANGTLKFKCTKNTAYDITIAATRQMTGTTYSDILPYKVYYEATWAEEWASITGNLKGKGTAPSNAPITMTLYGKILGGWDVSADSYSQTIAIQINF